MKIQQHGDKYGHTHTVESVDLVGLPVSTPKPEVEFYLSGIGRMEEWIVGELVGSGKFVNQKILVAGYYSRMARLTELPKV